MENLLSSDIVGQIIQVVGSIMVAVITYVVGPVVVKRLQQKPQPVQLHRLRYALAGGAAAAVTFVVIGMIFTALTPKPSIAITNPVVDQKIDIRSAQTGSGSFSVSGTSSGVYPNLKIYVLLHPVEPHQSGWWVQQPGTVYPNGQWSTEAWYGAKDHKPQSGNKIDILAIVTKPGQVKEGTLVPDLKDVNLVTQSEAVSLIIDSTK